jgi:hypothetical protein
MQHKKQYIKHSILAICLLCTVSISGKGSKNTSTDKNNKINIVANKTGITPSLGSPISTLYKEAASWLKTPYRRGGTSSRGMDCSGLTGTIYQNVFGIKLQRSSRDISSIDVKDVQKEELKPGDLVFFATSRRAKGVNHVGVYLGNRHFVHASCSNGVIISSLDEAYYRRTWVKGGKVKELNNSIFQKEERILADLTVKPLIIKDVKSPEIPSFETISLASNPQVFLK